MQVDSFNFSLESLYSIFILLIHSAINSRFTLPSVLKKFSLSSILHSFSDKSAVIRLFLCLLWISFPICYKKFYHWFSEISLCCALGWFSLFLLFRFTKVFGSVCLQFSSIQKYFSHDFLKYVFYPPPFRVSKYMYTRPLEVFLKLTIVCSFLSIFFSLCASLWIISIVTSLGSLIFYFTSIICF